MTTISEIGMPAIDPNERRPLPKPRRVLFVPLIVTAAIAVSVINLGATAYLYRIMDDLRDIDLRLNELAAFEQRLTSRLDAMNMGVQNRLENMSGELQGQFNQLHDGIAGMKASPNFPAVDLPVTSDAGEWGDIAPIEEPAIEPDSVQAEEAAAAPAIKKKPNRPAPPPNRAYERTQSADGKVYYRKVR